MVGCAGKNRSQGPLLRMWLHRVALGPLISRQLNANLQWCIKQAIDPSVDREIVLWRRRLLDTD
jgi:hypothetical protein